MSRTKGEQPKKSSDLTKRRRALTPEARENQLIALAYDVAEQQLLDGTISSQVLTQLLKAGSARGQAELKKIERENALLKAKADAIQSSQQTTEIYANALAAMKTYSGLEPSDGENV